MVKIRGTVTFQKVALLIVISQINKVNGQISSYHFPTHQVNYAPLVFVENLEKTFNTFPVPRLLSSVLLHQFSAMSLNKKAPRVGLEPTT